MQGIEINQQALIEVLQNKVAQAAIREAQTEAVIFQLQRELEEARNPKAVVENASAD